MKKVVGTEVIASSRPYKNAPHTAIQADLRGVSIFNAITENS